MPAIPKVIPNAIRTLEKKGSHKNSRISQISLKTKTIPVPQKFRNFLQSLRKPLLLSLGGFLYSLKLLKFSIAVGSAESSHSKNCSES